MITPEMVAELETGGTEGDAGGTQNVSAPPPSTKPVEEFEYYLGGKPSKLPGNAEFSFKHGEKASKIPVSQLINAYREFTHLKPKFQQLTEQEKKLQAQMGDLEAFNKKKEALAPFEKLQEWSLKRPDAFEFVMKHMKLDENGLLTLDPSASSPISPQNDGLNSVISALRDEIGGLKSWKETWEKEQAQVREQKEMSAIDEETKGLQSYLKDKGFDVDLDEQDENGISLRARIYKHGAENGIERVKAAALDYLADTLFDKAVQRGRTEAVKGVKGDAKAGIISRSSTPQNGEKPPIDVRRMNPQDRMNAALAELRELEAE